MIYKTESLESLIQNTQAHMHRGFACSTGVKYLCSICSIHNLATCTERYFSPLPGFKRSASSPIILKSDKCLGGVIIKLASEILKTNGICQ